MFRVLTCLSDDHDLRLVLLAGAICFLASYSAISLFHRAAASQGRSRLLWLTTASFATGCGIWATHFIAMLAYDPGVVVGYGPGWTVLSLVVAIVVTGAGLAVAVVAPRPWAAPLGGGIVGAGVASMHYLGMWALELPGRVTWAPDLVIASITLGMLFGIAALWVAERRDRLRESLGAAGLLTLAIVSHHFTAMGAVEIVPDPTIGIDHFILSPNVLAIAVAGAAISILATCLVAGLGDRHAKKMVTEKNELLDAAMTSMVQGLAVFNADGRLVLANTRYVEMYGLSPDFVKRGATVRELVEHRIERGSFFATDPEKYIADLIAAFGSRKPTQSTLELRDGRMISVASQPMAGGGWVMTHTDMTAANNAKKELEETRNFLDTIIENVPVSIVVKDARELRHKFVNRATEELYGIPRDELIGKTVAEVFPPQSAASIDQRDRHALENGHQEPIDEHPLHTPRNGTRIVTSTTLRVAGQDRKPQFLLTVVQDVTERKRAEARAARLAHHDPLTDLPNRAAFTACFNSMIEKSAAENKQFAILCVNLDRFKEVNDVFGHLVGDELLRVVAQRLAGAAEGAFVARLGGDEFMLIVDDNQLLASLAADRLQAAVSEEFEIAGQRLRIGLSVGIALYPVDGADATTLIGNADAALYRAKAEGRGSTRFFEAHMDKRVRERRALVHDLRMAIDRHELVVCYQPQARINGEIIGFEALVRWNHPTQGQISPANFIPIAEESGLILGIGEWVLRESCREAASWPHPLKIAINLSPVQFRHGDLPGLVHTVLLETGLAPSRLELEITEGVLINDLSRALSILRRLKLLGVRVAMDDFGTGYSSLSNLQAFPFDKIKIDRSFVSTLKNNAQSATIVRAVIGLGHGLDLPIVAEGVETDEQLAFLRAEACDEVQGFLLGKPLPIEAYAHLIGREVAEKVAVA